MAIVSGQTTGNTYSAAVITTVWGSDTTTGNTIVVGVLCNSGQTDVVNSITDTQGNKYIKVFTKGGSQTTEIWYASNITGGTTPTITLNFRSTLFGAVIAREYSGLALVNSYDTARGGNTSNGSSGTATSGSTPMATRTANEVIIGFTVNSSGTPTITLGAGYSNLTTQSGGGSTSCAIEDNIVAVTGLQTATFAMSSTFNAGTAVVCFSDTTLKQAQTVNNYQFGRAGDGMSVTEKIN